MLAFSTNFVYKTRTRRDSFKLAPYLRLKNIQGTTLGNIWKKIYFFKIFFLNVFFRKKVYFLKKSHNAEKPFRLIKRFYKPKTSKKCKGVPFNRIRKFSKKSLIVPKKTKRKKSFGLASTFGSKNNLWFSARIKPTISGFRKFVYTITLIVFLKLGIAVKAI